MHIIIQPLLPSISRTFSFSPTETQHTLNPNSPFPPPLILRNHHSSCLYETKTQMWNYTVCFLLWLAYFIQRIFKTHQCRIYQNLLPLQGWIKFHRLHTHHTLFSQPSTDGLFSCFHILAIVSNKHRCTNNLFKQAVFLVMTKYLPRSLLLIGKWKIIVVPISYFFLRLNLVTISGGNGTMYWKILAAIVIINIIITINSWPALSNRNVIHKG